MDNNDILKYLQGNRNIYYGRVLDCDDPLMLGRIRVHPDDKNLNALIGSNDEFDPNSNSLSSGKWSKKDPLIFLPLLPYYINQVPQVGERVLIIYYSNERQTISDKFYIVGPFSSPTRVGFEDYNSSNTHLSSGTQNDRSRFPNVKNLNGTYKNINNKGVFPEPTDIAIKGRGTSDLILKNNDVILRAGKHKNFNGNQIPEYNEDRSFLQLSKFDTKTVVTEGKKIFKLESQDRQLNYLIEYDIYNPESAPQIFTGSLTIYKFATKDQSQTKVSEFNYDTDLSGLTLSKAKIISIDNPLTLDQFVNYVKDQIIDFVRTGGGVVDDKTNLQFPFYYRPSKRIREILKLTPNQTSLNLMPFVNMQKLVSSLLVTTTDVTPGYGLVLDGGFSKFVPFLPKIQKTKEYNTIKKDNTVGILGGNQLFLLSNETTIPGKNKISFTDTAPTFSQDKIDTEVTPNTSSMVRGEELLELLELIVGFLITHTHAYPLLPPSEVAYDDTTINGLLKKMLDAYQKVLNSNIRIN